MLSKCANPTCNTPLHYLREGKIFKVEAAPNMPYLVNSPKPVRKVEHFWLCGPCSETMTLQIKPVGEVEVVSKIHAPASTLVRRAAAS